MVSLFRWHISRSMLSGWVSRQEHGIEKVHPSKRLESARGPLFEPPRDRLLRDSSLLGSCTTLVIYRIRGSPAGTGRYL